MSHPDAATWRKLGVKPGQRVVLRGAPASWSADQLPAGARLAARRGGAPADVLVAFFANLAALDRVADALGGWISRDGAVWVAWPRKAAGHVSDLSDQAIRSTLLPTGLVDVKVAMLDTDWSGLRFVWRRSLRGGG